MTRSNRILLAGAVALASAVPVIAGGLYVMLGNPDANPQARKAGAVVTIKLAGCHEPEKADVDATAIGTVEGRRQSIPLKLTKLAEPGEYAVLQQWPANGRWVLRFIAKEGERVTSTLVASGPAGVERTSAKMAMKMPSEADIAAMLAGGNKSEVARQ
jgi:hypothetical protein